MRWFLLLTALILSPHTVMGRVLRVPTDYSTIQAALDSVGSSDTVLVALGVYAEALQAPPRSFVLKGDLVPDTGDYPRPTIDPSALDSATMKNCLTLSSAGFPLTIEDFRFHNGPQMFPHDPWGAGGISDDHSSMTLRRCVFDSCFYGIRTHGASHVLEQCRFTKVVYAGLYAALGSIKASDCLFWGSGMWLVKTASGGDSSTIDRCEFRSDSCSFPLETSVRHVRHCLFHAPGAGHRAWESSLWFYASGDVSDNVVTDIAGGNDALGIGNWGSGMVTVRNNTFARLSPSSTGAIMSAVSYAALDTMRIGVRIEDNTFADCFSYGQSYPTATYLYGGAEIRHNHFANLGIADLPPVISAHVDSTIIRDNVFVNTGTGVNTWVWPDTFYVVTPDARWNYWGDSTGPYNANSNPNGLGVPVGDNVLFDPWYPDSSFLLAAKRPFIPQPSAFSLSAYPNPFNSSVRLHFAVPEAGIYRLELFNMLGQRVKELWSGPLQGEKDVIFDGAPYASGTYLARATNTIYNRPVATIKLVLLK